MFLSMRGTGYDVFLLPVGLADLCKTKTIRLQNKIDVCMGWRAAIIYSICSIKAVSQ